MDGAAIADAGDLYRTLETPGATELPRRPRRPRHRRQLPLSAPHPMGKDFPETFRALNPSTRLESTGIQDGTGIGPVLWLISIPVPS